MVVGRGAGNSSLLKTILLRIISQSLGFGRDPVNAVMNVWFPSNEDNFLPSRKTVGFSRTTLLLGVRMLKPVVGLRDCR